MKRFFIGLLFCFLLKFNANAQAPHELANKFTPVSPSASSLYQSINFPVSYATGKVDVSIPLYEVREGSLVLPISISYNSSGLKVSDPAGLIGMGWSLKAEPVITRQVKGRPDEDANGYLFNNDLNTNNTYPYLYELSRGEKDEEPDDFYYNTLNRAGQFFYKRKSVTNSSLGYDIINNPMSPVIINKVSNGFLITDAEGAKYTFNDTNAENTNSLSGSPSYKSTWKPTKIESVTSDDVINFSYLNENSQEHYFNFLNSITIEDFPMDNLDCTTPGDVCYAAEYELPTPVIRRHYEGSKTLSHVNNGSLSDICVTTGVTNSLSQTVIYTKKLHEITFALGKLTFEYWQRANNSSISGASMASNYSFMLKSISVYAKNDGNYTLQKKIQMYQDDDNWNREVLDSIKIFNAQNIPVDTYKFSYDEQAMPPYPNMYSDHWGYPNGYSLSGTNYTGVIYGDASVFFNPCIFDPYDPDAGTFGQPVNVTIGDANKDVNLLYTQTKTLKQITYPTGGFTTFSYESNQFKTPDNEIVTGGGLRINEIKNYTSANSQPIIRTIKYGKDEDGLGWGHKVSIDDYIYYKNQTYQLGNWNDKRSSAKRTYMINPVNSYFLPAGSAVVYDNVHEYSGTTNGNIGKTSYKYNYNADYLFYTRQRMSPTSLLMGEFRSQNLWGELLEKKIYEFNNGYNPKHKEEFKYEQTVGGDVAFSRKVYCAAEIVSSAYVPFNDSYYSFDTTLDGFAPGIKNLTQTRSVDYSNGDSIVSVNKTQYVSSNLNFPRKLITYKSTGDSTIIEKFYSTDLLQPVHTTMKTLNIVSPVVEEVMYKNGTTELSRLKTNYFQGPSNYILASQIQSSVAGNALTEKIAFHTYDSKGNVLTLSTKEGVKTSYLYSYNGQYPIAEIKNADYATVEGILGAGTVSTFTAQWPNKASTDNFLAPLFTALPQAQISKYVYSPLIGLTSQTDAKGQTTYYEYDTFQRLKTIKDQNQNILKSYDYHYKP